MTKPHCEQYYKFFEVIAHPSRWKIIELLLTKPHTVTEICEGLSEEQSKVSHNLSKLAACNVVKAEQIGRQRRYSLNKDTMVPLLELVGKHVHTHCKRGCNR